jgi:hypothetical protein
MSDVKKKLLADIDRKAQRIKEKRVEAASNKNIESYVFQFFKDIEVYANQQDKMIKATFMELARSALEEKLATLGYKPTVEIHYQDEDALTVQGVTVHWKLQSSVYIDVSQYLLSGIDIF